MHPETRKALGELFAKNIKPMLVRHGLRKSLTPAHKAKVIGYSPFGYYAIISSNCGGLSTMLPPVALFPEGPDQTGRQASVPDYSSGLKSPLFGFNISRRSRIPEIAGWT